MEAKNLQLQNEMKNVKSDHMNLEQSKRLCEQKLIDLDRKHSGEYRFFCGFQVLGLRSTILDKQPKYSIYFIYFFIRISRQNCYSNTMNYWHK